MCRTDSTPLIPIARSGQVNGPSCGSSDAADQLHPILSSANSKPGDESGSAPTNTNTGVSLSSAMLSRPGADYTGGEFLLVENRPRQQARGEAIRAEQGQLLIFPVHERPVPGKRGMLRAAMRHGASRIHSGERYALGIIFHDAE